MFLLDLARICAHGKTIPVMQQLMGLQLTLEDQGYPLSVEFLVSTDKPTVTAQLRTLAKRKPSAVLVNTDSQWITEAFSVFGHADIPIVQLGYDTEKPDCDAVVVDSFAGAYAAVTHLLKRGHTKIAILRWLAGLAMVNSNKKFAGYTAALADAGMTPDERYIKTISAGPGEPGWAPARMAVDELLNLAEPPTALFIENSFISMSLLCPLPFDNGALPAHIAQLDAVHFEDWPLEPVEDIVHGKLFYPPINAKVVAIDWQQIGSTAAQLLIEKAETKSVLPKIIRVEPTLQQLSNGKRTPCNTENNQ
jgi:DNA-binding LacI/PurR family transcriptional regulator